MLLQCRASFSGPFATGEKPKKPHTNALYLENNEEFVAHGDASKGADRVSPM